MSQTDDLIRRAMTTRISGLDNRPIICLKVNQHRFVMQTQPQRHPSLVSNISAPLKNHYRCMICGAMRSMQEYRKMKDNL